MLAAGANQQLHIRQARELERACKALLVDLFWTYRSARAFLRKPLSCLDNIPAPAVAHGHLQAQSVVAARAPLGSRDMGLQPHRQSAAVTDETHPHPVGVQLGDLTLRSEERRVGKGG